MFSHESTDNLLDNLEEELTELVQLDDPKPKTPVKVTPKIAPRPSSALKDDKISSPEGVLLSLPRNVRISSAFKVASPPIPARRNFFENSPEKVQNVPVPAMRKIHSMDKKGKNDENEIIQMTSLHSDNASASSDIEYISRGSSAAQNTVVSLEGERKRNNIKIIHESEQMPVDAEETFFVIKHGKWAAEEESNNKKEQDAESEKAFKPTLQVISEKPKIKKKKEGKKKVKEEVSSETSVVHKSSTDSSSLENSPKLKRRSKKQIIKKSKEKKKKPISDGRSSATTEVSVSKKSSKKVDATSSEKAIGIYVKNTGCLKFSEVLKSLKIKISIYNEDNGKQIGDAYTTKNGILNDDFFNLTCTWNEMITADYDIKQLQKSYNNVLIFFELLNSQNISICWAFLKLFSPKHINIDQTFKLQFFEYQYNSKSCFPSMFKRRSLNNNLSIFDQWQMNRRKFSSTLNIFIKDVNCNAKEVAKNDEAKNQTEIVNEKIQQWRKVPGQACKIPNKLFHKISLHEKGSMALKFSCDGNLLAYTEVSRNGYFLHVYKFPEMKKSFTMLEHSNFIHDIDWLKQKNYAIQRIVTASSDFTAIVWKLEGDSYTYTILPHPAFVYASKFLQKEDSEAISVVTAGRDSIIRIWRNRQGMQSFELVQELKHPIVNKFTYITSIVTRSADTFYTSSSTGDIIEWTMRSSRDYHLNRNFKLIDIQAKIVNNMDLNPRGNKIYFRVQDAIDSELSNSIYVLGVATGEITQKFQQLNLESRGRQVVRVTPCSTQIFCTNGSVVRHYQVTNGNLSASTDDKNYLNVKLSLGEKGFVSAMDYHPKDFFFACSIYGNHGGIIICAFKSNEEDKIEKMKQLGSQEVLSRSLELHQLGNLNNIIRRLDEVFLFPNERNEAMNFDDNTFTIENSQNSDSKRSRTYTVSQGPATFTIQKGQNNTYEIQRNDNSDDDATTISESFN